MFTCRSSMMAEELVPSRAGFGIAGMRERTAAGGTLEVAANRDAKGVTVTASCRNGPGRAGAVTAEGKGFRLMNILLVEDHAVVREGVRRLLSVHFD